MKELTKHNVCVKITDEKHYKKASVLLSSYNQQTDVFEFKFNNYREDYNYMMFFSNKWIIWRKTRKEIALEELESILKQELCSI